MEDIRKFTWKLVHGTVCIYSPDGEKVIEVGSKSDENIKIAASLVKSINKRIAQKRQEAKE